MSDLQDQAIRQYCKALRMPTIGGQFARLAEAATREGQSLWRDSADGRCATAADGRSG